MTNRKGKKRSLSEGDAAVKAVVNKKSKAGNEVSVQNGQADKGKTAKKFNKPNKKVQNKKQVEAANAKPTKAPAKPKDKVKPVLTVETLKQKIKQIEERENLSRSSKRRLIGLRKKLKATEEGKTESGQEVSGANENKKRKQVQNTNEQKKKLKPEKKAGAKQNKGNKKQNAKQGHLLLVKQQEKTDSDDDEDEDEEAEEEQEDALDSTENESQEDVEEEEEEDDDDDDEEDEEDDEDDDEEEDEEQEDKADADGKTNAKAAANAKKDTQNTDQSKKSNAEGKKKRYVLFVGNLPFSVTEDEIKKHFLTIVNSVVSVRIPTRPGETKSRGFAYVEVSNNVDYERALSLHNTFISGRKINVQYSVPKGAGRKKDISGKNQKLHALRKAGKLAGGRKPRNFGNKGKQNVGGKKT